MDGFFMERQTLKMHALSEIKSYVWRAEATTKMRYATVWMKDGDIVETANLPLDSDDYPTQIVPHSGPPVLVLTWYYYEEDDDFEVEEHHPIAWRVPLTVEEYALVKPVFVSPFHCAVTDFVVVLPNGKVSEMDTLHNNVEEWKEAKLKFYRANRKTKVA